ncbi:MAG: hypothetical protein P4L84_35340 [Isosphaeraceae bacterium]|nr:hypothetical protein [Isosphaeraceae bacterium]
MNEDIPLVPLVIGGLVTVYLGFEIEKQRSKMRDVFNIIDKKESVIADALEELVKSGQLKPYSPGHPA